MARYIETPNIHLRKPDVTDPDKTLGYWGEDLNFSLDTLDTYLWNSIGDVTTLTLPVTNLTAAVNMLDGFRPDYVLKDGKLGGQTIYGGATTGQNLTLFSNQDSDGKILLGSVSAYDEANIRLGIGTPSPDFGLEIYKNGAGGNASILLINGSSSIPGEASSFLLFYANAGSSKTSLSTTADNTIIGSINAKGVNSSNARSSSCAVIQFAQDGNAGATNIPGRITFWTGTNSTYVSERLRIDSTGLVTATGNIKAAGYKSSDGSDGLTQTVEFLDASAGYHVLTFKNGILTSYELS